jgi:hypothetical protein
VSRALRYTPALPFEYRASARRGTLPALPELLAGADWLPGYETEFRFVEDRAWRFDYAWPLFKIAFEQEGGAFARLITVHRGDEFKAGHRVPIPPGTRIRLGGRHQNGRGMELDIEKYNRAAIEGWLVLRGTTRQIRDGAALADLRAAFIARGLE